MNDEYYQRKIEELMRENAELQQRLSTTEQLSKIKNVNPIEASTPSGPLPPYSDGIRFRPVNLRREGYRATITPTKFILAGTLDDAHVDISPDTLDYFRHLSRTGHEWGPLSINIRPDNDHIIEVDGLKRAFYFNSVRGMSKIPIQIFPVNGQAELCPATEAQLTRLTVNGMFNPYTKEHYAIEKVSIVL